MTWGIISDSSCDLPTNAFAGSGLHFGVVPLKITVGNNEYIDNDDLDVNAMMADMKSYKGPSSSACPAPEEWAEEFRKSDKTVAVTMTSALSGTYNSALIGKKMVLEESPEKSIHVIDSHTTGGGLVLILRKLEELITQGLDFEAVVKQAEAYARSIFLLFSCGSYDNLVKNGRMSRIAGILASSLGIRAVAANTPEGTIRVLQKPRGEERALEAIVRTMSEWKNLAGQPVVISHCNNPVGAQRLKEKIVHVCMTTKITIMQTRGLTSFYNDNGGLMIAF